MNPCMGEPVSWMRLELYSIGEIDEPERVRVEEHLAACATCRACFAFLENDDRRPLAALPVPALRPEAVVASAPARVVERRTRGWSFGLTETRWAFAAAALVVVAVVSLWRQRMDAANDGLALGERASIKGGDVTFQLVRDDGEVIGGERGTYREGDRFKVLITCAPTSRAVFDLVVSDADGDSFPLAPAPDLRCGNGVPLPGAFRLTGRSPKKVCVSWSDTATPDRDAWGASERVLCKELVASAPGKP